MSISTTSTGLSVGGGGVVQQSFPRTVARPVANLGNTCYMNAVLQALAHAPELCTAMDCEPHWVNCPIFAENAAKKRAASNSSPSASTSATPLDDLSGRDPLSTSSRGMASTSNGTTSSSAPPATTTSTGTRKSLRSSGRKTPPDHSDWNTDGLELQFCALCEVEQHIRAVHDMSNKSSDSPVAPSTFVNGFIQYVAPWFKLGVQEDSHEFLRLLIDAMQKSCQQARVVGANVKPARPGDEVASVGGDHNKHDSDIEYPFSLFRGTVESNVICGSCQASNSTLDPIEDIGLEVTMPTMNGNSVVGSNQPMTDHHHHHNQRSSSSRNASPIQTSYYSTALADVQTAFQRFARAEQLDASYKCEKCHNVGRATKQFRLASIPPILTLHLKRFRYGNGRLVAGQGGSAKDNGGVSHGNTSVNGGVGTRTRTGRSEVSQLLNNVAGSEYWSGKSGSAKIEGHIKFDLIFDLEPYLTSELQKKHSKMYCRLFAVIVHAGKNSHSGHYYAYVRNITKNEWWKMDDARITAATQEEVMSAEAYMLFYRVMQHPVAVQLEELQKKKQQAAAVAAAAAAAAALAEKTSAIEIGAIPEITMKNIAIEETSANRLKVAEQQLEPTPEVSGSSNNNNKPNSDVTTRKRTATMSSLSSIPSLAVAAAAACFADGEAWAKAKTRIPPHLLGILRKAEEMIAENMQISSADFLKAMEDEASKEGAALGKGPTNISLSEDDIFGGVEIYRRKLSEFFYRLAKHFDSNGAGGRNDTSWLLPPGSGSSTTTTQITDESNNKNKRKHKNMVNTDSTSSEKRVAVVEPEDADLL